MAHPPPQSSPTVDAQVIGRLILTNIMPSLVSKIEFLAASNLNGNLVLCATPSRAMPRISRRSGSGRISALVPAARCVIYLLCSLVNTIVFAAAMTSDSFTFVAVGPAGWKRPLPCLRTSRPVRHTLDRL